MDRRLSQAESGPNNGAHAVTESNCFTLPRLRSLARPAVVSSIEIAIATRMTVTCNQTQAVMVLAAELPIGTRTSRRGKEVSFG